MKNFLCALFTQWVRPTYVYGHFVLWCRNYRHELIFYYFFAIASDSLKGTVCVVLRASFSRAPALSWSTAPPAPPAPPTLPYQLCNRPADNINILLTFWCWDRFKSQALTASCVFWAWRRESGLRVEATIPDWKYFDSCQCQRQSIGKSEGVFGSKKRYFKDIRGPTNFSHLGLMHRAVIS